MKNNLKLLRKSRGYTQIALQMKTGIEQALLSKFENDERVPPTETLLLLADFYDVSIDYILCRTDIPEINKKWATVLDCNSFFISAIKAKFFIFHTVLKNTPHMYEDFLLTY